MTENQSENQKAQKAKTEFTAIVREEVLKQKADQASSSLDIYRYDFAMKVAQGNKLSDEDGFKYLLVWAEYNITFREYESMPLREFPKLKEDCLSKEKSELVRKQLENRIEWVKKMIPHSKKMGKRLAQNDFLGLPKSKSPTMKAVYSVIYNSASEQSWLPYELKGLEDIKSFF